MSLIVFSDIHGNIDAFEKAVKVMEQYSPTAYLFLGDMAGYYYYQNECIALLKKLPNLISIKGNHDNNFLQALSDENLLRKLDEKYGRSYSILKENITDVSLEYLSSMQDYEKNKLYEAYHGSPTNYDSEYIYPDNSSLKLDGLSVPYLFLGHTHYMMDKNVNNTRVINPGSIGQPRDTNKPSFAVIDTISNVVEFVRFNYNNKKLLDSILSKDNNSYLIDVLKRR